MGGEGSERRRPDRSDRPAAGKEGGEGWLALSDDDLLFTIQGLGEGHGMDEALLEVVRSDRHFFIRQEAAKRIADRDLLNELSHDRHIGPILVRRMTREADVAYLERLVAESRHIEVRRAAEAQLRLILMAKKRV